MRSADFAKDAMLGEPKLAQTNTSNREGELSARLAAYFAFVASRRGPCFLGNASFVELCHVDSRLPSRPMAKTRLFGLRPLFKTPDELCMYS